MSGIILPGATPLSSIAVGATRLSSVRLGSTLIWTPNTGGAAYDNFWDLEGMLINWVHELFGSGNLLADGLVSLITTIGDTYGRIVNFIDTTSSYIGGLINSGINGLNDLEGQICGGLQSVGGQLTDVWDGIIGFVNNVPVVASQAVQFIMGIPSHLNQLIGTIPIIGNLAQLLGLAPKPDGTVNEPLNYIVDGVGNVIGFLTCHGQFQDAATHALTDVNFALGVAGQGVRVLIPDGLMSLGLTTGQSRMNTAMAADDGFIETQVTTIGDPGYVTQLFRRYSNDGSGARGVGMSFQDSAVQLVNRVAGVAHAVTDAVPYTPGDVHIMLESGDTHTLLQNGAQVAQWVDNTAAAAVGSAYRSVGMMAQGAKELLGPRRFSPTLAYVQAA